MITLKSLQTLASKVYGEDVLVDACVLKDKNNLVIWTSVSVFPRSNSQVAYLEVEDEKLAYEMAEAALKVKAPKRGRPKKNGT